MSKANPALLVLLTLAQFALGDTDSPNLGQAFDSTSVPATILTDGTGLPAGAGDAVRGEIIYRIHCLACHGPDGQNGINDTLVGGHGTLTDLQPVKTVGSYWPYATTLFDYINRAMPYQAPGSLTTDEVYAVAAYLLYKNKIIDRDTVLTAQTLPNIKMPNQHNFVWHYSEK